jgi:DNA-binding response OmpR family regulator
MLTSGDTAIETRVPGRNAGADDFLVKPFAVSELIARIHAVLRRLNRPAHEMCFRRMVVNRVRSSAPSAAWATRLAASISPRRLLGSEELPKLRPLHRRLKRSRAPSTILDALGGK